MNNLHPRFRGTSVLLAGLFAALVFLGSCNSETPPMCPRTGVGVLEGYLRVQGQGVEARIRARSLDEGGSARGMATTETDSTGWYRLELPTGLYRLEVDPMDTHTSSSDFYDTVRVLPRVLRFDFKRGRAEIRLRMPADLEGSDFHLSLDSDDIYYSMFEHARVEDGLLDFEFPVLVPGPYNIEISGNDLAAHYYLPGFTDRWDADILEVGLTGTAVYEADFTDSYSSISGSVTGSWQLGGWGSQPGIRAYSPDSLFVGRRVVDSQGDFTMGFLLPGAVRLHSEINEVVWWIGGETFASAREFDLQPGDRITGVDVVESGLDVRLDGPGEYAYHQPYFTVRAASGEEFHPHLYYNGPFVISNLRPGRYYLFLDGYCDDQVWAPQWFGGSESPAGATPIDLAEGERRPISMDLIRGGRIEGNLLRADGTRPRSIMYGLFDTAGEDLCSRYRQWRQFDEGRFRFQGLPDGDFLLGVQTSGDVIWWYPGTAEITAAVPLTIENHGDLTGVDWRLP